MDPLSVTASIVGILCAAAKVSSVLNTFVRNTKGAPKLAQAVLVEVNSLSAVLGQLQNYLLGAASSSKSRSSLILVEQVIVTLAECVTTFSELEDVLETGRIENDFKLLDRMKWAMKESKISDIQRRLQSNKTSLTLMLTILQCKSMEEAESAMVRLCNLVEQVLAKNEEMSLRLRNIDDAVANQQKDLSKLKGDAVSTVSSDLTVTPPLDPFDDTGNAGDQQRHVPTRSRTTHFNSAFEEDLLASRVYRKPLFSQSGESLATSAARSTASSVLSALSLTDVSNISILAVPIYSHEISNSARYTFGDFNPSVVTAESQQTPEKPVVWHRRLLKVMKSNPSQARAGLSSRPSDSSQIKVILGVSLHESLQYANVAISLFTEKGESYIYGYIPIFVAKIGVFLKEKGLDVENIFAISGSPIRLQQLESIFNKPPRYGKGLDWTGYTVHDAANILLRFLLQLPEPVIPIDQYGRFQDAYVTFHENPESTTSAYVDIIKSIQPTSRQLLLYLLDLLAVFASKVETNKMGVSRLAAIFQPAILSPVATRDEEFIEEAMSREKSREVLVFLIENQDQFLIGAL